MVYVLEMLRTLLCTALICVSSPAAACVYLNHHGQSIAPTVDGSGFVFEGGAGVTLDCRIASPNRIGWLDVDCGMWTGQMLIGPSSLGADDIGLIVFQKSFFYLVCDARA